MLAWQPEETDAALSGQAQAALDGSGAVTVKQEPERPAGADPVAQMAGPKEWAAGVLPQMRTFRLLSAQHPGGTPGRQVTLRRLVQGK